MGQGIAIALAGAGHPVTLLARTPRPLAPPLAVYTGPWDAATRDAGIILVATPDDAIEVAARALLDRGAVRATHAVLHLSGLLDRRALKPLELTGAALGSFHPLQSVADPRSAGERLAGAYAALEGDERAVQEGEGLAAALGMHPLRLSADAKVRYHTGAVMAANYSLALVGVAERLARAAGVPADVAARMYLPLLQGTAANAVALGLPGALTGPVRRGDVATIRRHLDALDTADRELYRAAGRAALALARDAGMDEIAARRVEDALTPD
jgi:predicted short-subunit dehydrogenase-like oxidoreductase (DUF2520 family)